MHHDLFERHRGISQAGGGFEIGIGRRQEVLSGRAMPLEHRPVRNRHRLPRSLVAAFRGALDEHTRKKMTVPMARNTGNQGIAQMLIAERPKDGTMAATALYQIEAAINLARIAGDTSAATYYETQLMKVRAVRDQSSAPRRGRQRRRFCGKRRVSVTWETLAAHES